MEFREPDRCITSWTVLDHRQPARLVVHYSDGTWLITCGDAETADELTTVHVQHLLDDPVQLLAQLRNLPPGREAWRDDPSHGWVYSVADER